jgi:hypothetical protein
VLLGNISSCVNNVDPIFLRNGIWNIRGKIIKTDGHKLLLEELKLIVISECDRIPYYEGIFQPGPD